MHFGNIQDWFTSDLDHEYSGKLHLTLSQQLISLFSALSWTPQFRLMYLYLAWRLKGFMDHILPSIYIVLLDPPNAFHHTLKHNLLCFKTFLIPHLFIGVKGSTITKFYTSIRGSIFASFVLNRWVDLLFIKICTLHIIDYVLSYPYRLQHPQHPLSSFREALKFIT